jgi:hypothetical protein
MQTPRFSNPHLLLQSTENVTRSDLKNHQERFDYSAEDDTLLLHNLNTLIDASLELAQSPTKRRRIESDGNRNTSVELRKLYAEEIMLLLSYPQRFACCRRYYLPRS